MYRSMILLIMRMNRYMAEFEYMDAQYRLIGLMEKEEFDKIIKNLIFL